MPETVRNTISFLLDDEEIQLHDVDPNRTVLQWLREDRQRTGTKEGCAEGDCGACAVVIAELDADGKNLRHRAVNSCIQFLPTLDGKQLITVENLQNKDGTLHPVQQAMVDEHGSQCGFCTPGFVMSMYALFETVDKPTRVEIDDALAGNLCRCTGYRPIISATQKMYELPKPASRHTATVAALRKLRIEGTVGVEANGRRYYAPSTLKELSELVQKNPAAHLLAGGTDVGLWVTKQHQELDSIIYVGAVAELQTVTKTKSHLELGAAVTFTDAMPVLNTLYPQLDELLRRFAGPPIRNAATIGGNIANGSPIGDSMPALIALDTILVLRRGDATRELALDEFYLAYQQTALAEGEFLERIRIPLPDPALQLCTYKISKRFDQDISAVCAAFAVRLDGDTVAGIRIAYGGVAAIPSRAPKCERVLTGAKWTEKTVLAATQALEQDFSPISDMRATDEYRMQVSKNLLLKFFYATTQSDPPVSVYSYGR